MRAGVFRCVCACVCTCVSCGVCTVRRECYRGWKAAGTAVEGACRGGERGEGEESQKGGEIWESSCAPSQAKTQRKTAREGWTATGLPGGPKTPEGGDLEREWKAET